MVAGSWYMLDLHYDNVTSAGQIIIENVAQLGVGGQIGIQTGNNMQLVNVDPLGNAITRQHYTGDPNFPGQTTDPVYRTVFRLNPNISGGTKDDLSIEFKSFKQGITDYYEWYKISQS